MFKEIIKKYNLLQMQSATTGELFQTWFRQDKLLFIENIALAKGEHPFLYRIIPNTNAMHLIGHINFSDLEFHNFEEAAEILVSLKLGIS